VSEFEVTVNDAVSPQDLIQNTANLDYSTLPGSPAVPIAEKEYSGSGTKDININDISVSKTIDATNIGDTSDPNLAIGEEVTFLIEVDIPEGELNDLEIKDVFPSHTNVANGSISAINDGGGTPGARSTSYVGNAASLIYADYSYLPGGGGTGTDGAGHTTISFKVKGVVEDNVANTNNTDLNNNVTVSFKNGTGTTKTVNTSKQVKIVEPIVGITKSVAGGNTINGGDTKNFTITLENTGLGHAYDLDVTDVLPDGFTPSAISDGGSYDGPSHTITWDAVDLSSLVPSATKDLSYTVTIDDAIESGVDLTNTVTLNEYFSTPNNTFAERRTYDSAPHDSVTLTVDSVSNLVKTLHSTDLADTVGDNIARGETVTYRATIDVPEGTTTNFFLKDTLPVGLNPVSGTLISDGGLTHSFVGPATIAGQLVTFDFGNVTNTPGGGVKTITVEIVAQAKSDAIPGNLINTIKAYKGAVEQASTTKDITIVVPNLSITKTSPTVIGDSGDEITYTVVIQNNGNAPAYDVVATDALHAKLEYVSGSTTLNTVVVSDISDADEFDFGQTTAGELTFDFDQIDPGAGNKKTIVYKAKIKNSAEHNDALLNTFEADYDTYPGANVQQSSSNISGSKTVTAKLDGAVVKTFTGAFATAATSKIGDTIPYTITIDVAEGTIPNFVITDTLPLGLGYIPGSVTSTVDGDLSLTNASGVDPDTITPVSNTVGNPSNDDQVLVWDLGQVVNSNTNNGHTEQIIINFEAVVLNNDQNNNNDTHSNHVSVAMGLANPVVDDSNPITIKEPIIISEKTSNYISGDTIHYTIKTWHTAASGNPANNVVITDTLPAGTSYNNASFTVPGGDPIPVVDTSDPTHITFTYSDLNTTYVVGGEAEFSFDVTIANSVASTSVLANQINTTWTSQVGAYVSPILANPLSSERTGNTADDGGSANDYAYAPAGTTDLTVHRPNLSTSSKAVIDLNGGDLQGNDVLEYTVTIINTGDIAATGIQVIDDMPANTGDLDVRSIAGGVDASLPAGGANDTKTIVYRITVDSNIGSGTNIENSMTVHPASEGGTGATDSVSMTTLEPILRVTKTVNPISVSSGDTATFTVIVENTGDSDSLNTTITDTIPAGLTYTPESIKIDGVDQTDADDGPVDNTDFGVTTANTITVVLPVLSHDPTSVEITYNVTLTSTSTNTVNATDDHGEHLIANSTLTQYVSGGGSGGIFTKSKTSDSDGKKKAKKKIVNPDSRDLHDVLKKVAPAEGPKFNETGEWEPIEQCLRYDPDRKLKFSDVDKDPSIDANVIKSTLLFDALDNKQYVMSGYATRLDDIGEKTAGLENSLTRLEWAKVLMVSHCLPIYDYELLPKVTAFGHPMPSYTDLPFDVKDPNDQTRWMMEVAYSASYYEIINGTGENLAAIMRSVSGAEAIKMFIRTGEFVHAGEFERSTDGLSADFNPEAWYYEFFAKAAFEGTLKEYINSLDSAGNFVIRRNAVNLLLDALLRRDLYRLDDEKAIEALR